MKRLILLFSIYLLCTPLLALAESIDNFASSISLRANEIQVTETITYNFGVEQHHGIYRDLPIKYDAGYGNRNIEIDILNVRRDDLDEPYTTSKQDSRLQIKIGSPDLTISGIHTYTISYSVRGAINFFDDFDELYWNVTGNDWPVPITQVAVEIILPPSATLQQQACYQGPVGSQELCDFSQTDRLITFSTNQPLAIGEGLTIAIGLAKGFWQQPTFLQNL